MTNTEPVATIVTTFLGVVLSAGAVLYAEGPPQAILSVCLLLVFLAFYSGAVKRYCR